MSAPLSLDEMARLRVAAQCAVRCAAALTRAVQHSFGSSDALAKADTSPVTVGDLGVQAVIALSLRAQLHSAAGSPPFRLLAEEDAATFLSGGPALIGRVVTFVNAAYPKSGAAQDARAAAADGASMDSTLQALLANGKDSWSADDIASAIAAGEFGKQSLAPSGGIVGSASGALSASSSSGSSSSSAFSEDGGAGYWILDPVDGTKGFVRGAKKEPGAGHQYCIGLAFIHGGIPVVGVLGCPSLPFPSYASTGASASVGTLFSAQAGCGATQEPLAEGLSAQQAASQAQPISTDGEPDQAALRVCESYEAGHSDHGLSSRISQSLGITSAPVRLDSMCKYGLLARGDGHVYLRFPRAGYIENAWDHAAGSIVLQEAGGVVTDAHGRPLDFSLGASLSRNEGVIASACPALHARVLEAVAGARNS